MRGFHTAALFAVVALAMCAGGAADTNTPQTRGAGASNIGTAGARPSLNITTTAERSQGSDADELTRRRRPVKDKDHGHEPPKHDEPDWCTPMLSCYKDSDCLDELPCQKTYCKLSHRGKQGQKEGNCVCKGPRDDGCSCLDGCDPGKLSPVEKACLNTNQKCKCIQDGTCKPNYLPKDTYCDSDALNPSACQVGKCSASGECKLEPRDVGSACYDGDMTCENAGKCQDDDTSSFCEKLDCSAACPSDNFCGENCCPTAEDTCNGDTCVPACLSDNFCGENCCPTAEDSCNGDTCVPACPSDNFCGENCCPAAEDSCNGDTCVPKVCAANADCSSGLCCSQACVDAIGDPCPDNPATVCCVDDSGLSAPLQCKASPCPCMDFGSEQCPAGQRCCGDLSHPLETKCTIAPNDKCPAGLEPCSFGCSIKNGNAVTVNAFCGSNSGDACELSCDTCSTNVVPGENDKAPKCNNGNSCKNPILAPDTNINSYCKATTGDSDANCVVCKYRGKEKGKGCIPAE